MWIDISDVLTEAGAAKVKVGQVLMFEKPGGRNELKVMRKARGKVWCRYVITHDPADVVVTDATGSVRLDGGEV